MLYFLIIFSIEKPLIYLFINVQCSSRFDIFTRFVRPLLTPESKNMFPNLPSVRYHLNFVITAKLLKSAWTLDSRFPEVLKSH